MDSKGEQLEAAPADNIAAEDMAAEDITTKDMAAKNIIVNGMATKDITADDITVRDIEVIDIAAEDITVKDLAAMDIAAEDITAKDMAAKDIVTEDIIIIKNMAGKDIAVAEDINTDGVAANATADDIAADDMTTDDVTSADVGDAAAAAVDTEGKDPLLVLPPEMLHMICALLPPEDLARLSELSTGWRDLSSDEALWRDADLSLNDNRPPTANELRVLLRAPCLGALDTSDLRALEPGKKLAEALCKFRKTRKLSMSCSSAGALPLLERLSPYLEELELFDLMVEHLEVVGTMPVLRSLVLNMSEDFNRTPPAGADEMAAENPDAEGAEGAAGPQYLAMLEGLTTLRELEIYRDPPIPAGLDLGLPLQLEELYVSQVTQMQLEAVQRMPALRRLDVDHDGSVSLRACSPLPPGRRGLLWLGVSIDQYSAVADIAMASLVREHAASLEELVIRNDDPDMRDELKRRYLVDTLQECEMQKLRSLVLHRKRNHKCGPACQAQIAALTAMLRRCRTKVECKVPSPSSDSDSDSDDSDDSGGPPGPPGPPQYINIADFDGCSCVLCKAPLNR